MATQKKTIILLLLILALAAFFRFWQLEQIPPGLYPDVAMNGNDAIEALRSGNFRVFYPDNNGREGFFINLIAFSFWLFGPSVWAIKLVPAIIGWLTVLGMYFLTKELFGYGIPARQRPKPQALAGGRNDCEITKKSYRAETIALLSAFFLAISFWHINFSRLGFRAIMVPFCLVWSFYFIYKATRMRHADQADDKSGLEHVPSAGRLFAEPSQNEAKQKKGWSGCLKRGICPSQLTITIFFILAGIFFGLGFHTYIAFRVAPIILAPILIIGVIAYWPRFKFHFRERLSFGKFLKQVYIKDGWFGWDAFLLAAIIVILPIAIYFFQHPADFMGRTGQVSVLASSAPLKSLFLSTIKTLGQFVAVGDFNWRHNLSGSPQIFWPLIPLFLWGLIYSIAQIFRPQNYRRENLFRLNAFYTLLVWWSVMLLPSVLTNEGLPHALRAIGAIPPSYIFVGLGAFLFLKLLKRKARNYRLLVVSCCLLAVALGAAEFYRYFIFWGRHQETRGAFTQLFVDQANYLNSLPQNIKKYVIVNEGGVPVPYPDGIPMPAQTIIFLTQKNPSIHYLIRDEVNFAFLQATTPAILLPMNPNNEIFQELRQSFPNGIIEQINDFRVFKIGL